MIGINILYFFPPSLILTIASLISQASIQLLWNYGHRQLVFYFVFVRYISDTLPGITLLMYLASGVSLYLYRALFVERSESVEAGSFDSIDI